MGYIWIMHHLLSGMHIQVYPYYWGWFGSNYLMIIPTINIYWGWFD